MPHNYSEKLKQDYSEKELCLFSAMDIKESIMEDRYISVITIYRMMAEECFLENRQDDVAQSVRNCLNAMNKMNPKRMTPEWDKLIVIKE